MQALHKLDDNPSQKNRIKHKNLSKFEESIHKLKNYLERLSKSEEKGLFEKHEKMISQLSREIGCEAIAETLSHYDVGVEIIQIGDQIYRKKYKSKKMYQTELGPIEIERHIYANRKKDGDGQGVVPMELQTGIIEGYWTPGAAKNATWAVAHLPPQEVEDLFFQLGGMNPSKSNLDRLPKALQQHWEPCCIKYANELIQKEEIPKEATHVSVSLDGVMIALKPEKKCKNNDSVNAREWREASCGTISFFNEEGERLSTIQYARMPEHKKVTLKNLLKQEIEEILKKRPELKLIHIADGAQDNWSFFDEEMPIGFQVTDFYHACEYLKKAFNAVYENDKATEQYQKYKIILRDEEDGIQKVLRALRYLRDTHKGNESIREALTYFVNNSHRMKYAEAKKLNYPIGSGIVEAACKSLVGQRMKRSGMSWRFNGGQAVLTFRSLIKSHRFDKAWDMLSSQYKKGLKTIDNVIAFPGQNLS